MCQAHRKEMPLSSFSSFGKIHILHKGGEYMGSFGGFNEKKKKKQKQGDKKNQSGFSNAPIFVAPTVIKKGKREE